MSKEIAEEQGDPKAADKLLELVYEDLRQLATHRIAQELPGQTLQPTALVHEAWLRLVGSETPNFENRAHFFSAADEANCWAFCRASLFQEIKSH